MTKYLVTINTENIVFRKVKKGSRPMAIVNDRFYRLDDEIAFKSFTSNVSLVVYDIDEQQPYGNGDYLDPEFTKVQIDSIKLGKGKVGKLSDLSFDKVAMLLMVVVTGWAILSQVLGGS